MINFNNFVKLFDRFFKVIEVLLFPFLSTSPFFIQHTL